MIHITSRDPGPPPVAYIAQSGGLHTDMAVCMFVCMYVYIYVSVYVLVS